MTKKNLMPCVLALTVILPPWAAFAANPTGPTADLVHEAFRQMGGEDKMKALRTAHFKTISHRNALEQSERPDAPTSWSTTRFPSRETWNMPAGNR